MYLTNRELLAAIHASKLTYCSYLEPADGQHDTIVASVEEITPALVQAVREKKAKPRGKPKVDINTIPPESLVFRVMTADHVPLDPNRKSKSRTTSAKHTKTAFPPFKHYRVIDGQPVEVLRSHWKGGFENGHFEVHGGRITDRLGLMFMMLVERYGRRPNFRNYSYLEEMKGQALLQLSQVGLQFDESKSDNPFAFYTTTIRNCFVRVLNTEKKCQDIRDDLLQEAGSMPSHTRQARDALEQRGP